MNKFVIFCLIAFVAIIHNANAVPIKLDSCAGVCKTYCYELGMCYKRCDGRLWNPQCECTKCEATAGDRNDLDNKNVHLTFKLSPPQFI